MLRFWELAELVFPSITRLNEARRLCLVPFMQAGSARTGLEPNFSSIARLDSTILEISPAQPLFSVFESIRLDYSLRIGPLSNRGVLESRLLQFHQSERNNL